MNVVDVLQSVVLGALLGAVVILWRVLKRLGRLADQLQRTLDIIEELLIKRPRQ